MTYVFDPLSEHHRHAVIDIFNLFVTNGFAAYPDTPVDSGFFDRLLEMANGYPALAVKDHVGGVVGFGMLRPHHFATTFKRTAEVSYFLLPDWTRRGIGTALLERLVEEARKLRIDSILASISSRNEDA